MIFFLSIKPVNTEKLLSLFPVQFPFLFVDKWIHVDENTSEGSYTFKKDEFFYAGHFSGNPITPGVILAECLGQIGAIPIGLVNLGEVAGEYLPLLSIAEMEWFEPVFPGEEVRVTGEKVYFRNQILRCKCRMFKGEVEVCMGILTCKFVKR